MEVVVLVVVVEARGHDTDAEQGCFADDIRNKPRNTLGYTIQCGIQIREASRYSLHLVGGCNRLVNDRGPWPIKNDRQVPCCHNVTVCNGLQRPCSPTFCPVYIC